MKEIEETEQKGLGVCRQQVDCLEAVLLDGPAQKEALWSGVSPEEAQRGVGVDRVP